MILDSVFDLEPFMRQLATQVEPSAAKKLAAAKSHNNLRDLLIDRTFGKRILGSYLSGSYSRDTAIHPIDDVDVVFLIDQRAWKEGDYLFSSKPNPSDVLRSFATALRRRYERASVYTQRRSVRLELQNIDIDVVPAIPKHGGLIEIPDVRAGDWLTSGPAIHRDLGAAINNRARGSFKPTVKLIKYWNSNLPSTAQLKSFTVESIAMALFAHHRADGLYDSVTSFFDFVAGLAGADTVAEWSSDYGIDFGILGPTVPDPSGATANVARGLDSQVLKKFLAQAVRTRDLLVHAGESQRSATSMRAAAKALKFELTT